MKELIKNFLIYGFGGILTKLVGFILLPVLTTTFTIEEFGFYDLILSISTIAATISILQFEVGFQRFFYLQKNDEEKKVLISTVFSAILISSVFASLLLLSFVPAISNLWFKSNYRNELIIASIEILFTNITAFLYCVLRYDDRPKIYTSISVCSAFLNAVLIIISVKVLHIGVLGAIFSNFLTQLFITYSLLYIERKNISFVIERRILKEVSSFAFPTIPARLGSVSNAYANRFLMISMFSASMLGIYSFSVKISSVMVLLQTAFQSAWLPFLYKIINKDGHKKIISDIFLISLRVVCLISIVLTLFSEEIVRLIATDEYLESTKIIGILTLYQGLFIVKDTSEIGVKVTGKSIYVSYAFFASVIANLVLLFTLPTFFGLSGVAISLLFSNIVLLALTIYFSNRLYKIDFPIALLVIYLILTVFLTIVIPYIQISFAEKILVVAVIFVICLYAIRNKLKQIFYDRNEN